MERAARGEKQWVPTGPSKEVISEIYTFAKRATNNGCADPEDMDDYLREGSNAFLSRDYQDALRIFHALLSPLCDGEIDLGQHEMVDEVPW